jgi:2-dehydropantoate 2-reductase
VSVAGDGSVAILGPGGVGGLLAGALARAGTPVTVVARESTAELIARQGVRVDSVRMGAFTARPDAVARLTQPTSVLIVATKATGLTEALERVAVAPALVLPLLNGVEHLAVLRERFPAGASAGAADPVAAGAIRVEADRPEPGVVVHTSPFLRIDMASHDPRARPALEALASVLERAQVPAQVLDSEAQVLWTKLVRLNALACTTSAFDLPLGPIRSTPELRAELVGALEEGAAVARAEGADVRASSPLGELEQAHASLGSSMQRDIAAGREPELEAIPGAVLRAAARHDIACPTIERLVAEIVRRTGLAAPVVAG